MPLTTIEFAQHMHHPRGRSTARDLDLLHWDRTCPSGALRPLLDEVQWLRDEVDRLKEKGRS